MGTEVSIKRRALREVHEMIARDLPDGAYFAMAEEMGLSVPDDFIDDDEFEEEVPAPKPPKTPFEKLSPKGQKRRRRWMKKRAAWLAREAQNGKR